VGSGRPCSARSPAAAQSWPGGPRGRASARSRGEAPPSKARSRVGHLAPRRVREVGRTWAGVELGAAARFEPLAPGARSVAGLGRQRRRAVTAGPATGRRARVPLEVDVLPQQRRVLGEPEAASVAAEDEGTKGLDPGRRRGSAPHREGVEEGGDLPDRHRTAVAGFVEVDEGGDSAELGLLRGGDGGVAWKRTLSGGCTSSHGLQAGGTEVADRVPPHGGRLAKWNGAAA
jgi:hypothetical protein